MVLYATTEFSEWVSQLDWKARAQVDDRLDRIRWAGHFGDARRLKGGLFELRWKNGRRVYGATVAREATRVVLLLWGGGKDGQERDIEKARKLLKRECAQALHDQ